MNELQQRQLATHLENALGGPIEIVHCSSRSGGSINSAYTLLLADGRQVFVKTNRQALQMFRCEARGLEALRTAACFTVPQVIAIGELPEGLNFLVLEQIESAAPALHFWEQFGRQLAELHQASRNRRFGFEEANYIGSTPQPNKWSTTWAEFFATQRIEPQLRLALSKRLLDCSLEARFRRLIEHLPELLKCDTESATLLHGDLWSGNYVVDCEGAPALIDPAVYYGNREAELSMPLLFGGFPQAFFDAYNEAWPLEPGWRLRNELYQLYHLMNHANLFGGGYIESCVRILKRFV